MKILIDEQLPTKLKYLFSDSDYEVLTVRDMKWLGTKNGRLIELMTLNNFQVLLTNDKNLTISRKLAL